MHTNFTRKTDYYCENCKVIKTFGFWEWVELIGSPGTYLIQNPKSRIAYEFKPYNPKTPPKLFEKDELVKWKSQSDEKIRFFDVRTLRNKTVDNILNNL